MAKRNGRRAMRDELQSTWTVYDPPRGAPIRKRDIAGALDITKLSDDVIDEGPLASEVMLSALGCAALRGSR